MLILFFTSKADNLYINSQFYHSSGIYFEPISKIRLFSENYNFISYFDILQPENLKYKIVDISHKLYEHCILTNIANNCNIYNHHTQLEFMKKRINYFLGEISFITRQAHNITKIPKNSDPFLHQIRNVLLQSKIRQKTSLYWPKENLFLLPNPFSEQLENLSSNLNNVTMYKDWHKSQIYPNLHIYRILAANWLMDLHEISRSFLSLLTQLTEAMTHAATNLWHPMLLPDTFLDFKSNKEDPHLPTSLFSMVIPFSKIRYFTFNNYLIFTMTIPIPSSEEFQVFKTHSTPIHFDFNTDYIIPIFIKPQFSYIAISPNNESYFTTNENFLASCHQNGLQNFCHPPHSIYSTQNNPICETSMFIKSQPYKCKTFISFNEYPFLTPLLSHRGWLYSTILPKQIFLSCSKNSKTLITLQGIGILQIEFDCNLDSSIPYYNIKN